MFLPRMGGLEQHIYYYAKHSRMNHAVLTDLLADTRETEDYGHITAHRVPAGKEAL